MNTRMLIPGTLLALTALAALKPSAAARIGEAEVREGPRGGPCFTIGAREEKLGIPNFQSLVVMDGPRLVWKLTTPRERTFALSAGMCVPYGGKVAALPRTQAAELVPGRIYNLRIEARPGVRGAAQLAYHGRFCLVRQPDGSARVRQLPATEQAGRPAVECSPASY